MPDEWAITEVNSYKIKLWCTPRREFRLRYLDILAKAFNCLAAFVKHKLMCSLKFKCSSMVIPSTYTQSYDDYVANMCACVSQNLLWYMTCNILYVVNDWTGQYSNELIWFWFCPLSRVYYLNHFVLLLFTPSGTDISAIEIEKKIIHENEFENGRLQNGDHSVSALVC